MELEQMKKTGVSLTRTGRASGCSCCSFTAMSLIALPILAVIAFLLAA